MPFNAPPYSVPHILWVYSLEICIVFVSGNSKAHLFDDTTLNFLQITFLYFEFEKLTYSCCRVYSQICVPCSLQSKDACVCSWCVWLQFVDSLVLGSISISCSLWVLSNIGYSDLFSNQISFSTVVQFKFSTHYIVCCKEISMRLWGCPFNLNISLYQVCKVFKV